MDCHVTAVAREQLCGHVSLAMGKQAVMKEMFSVWSVPGHDMLCKTYTDRGLVCSAKGRFFNNMLSLRNKHLMKGQAHLLVRGCYIRTITARVQLEKISSHGPQVA
jgi:hypothetical protein